MRSQLVFFLSAACALGLTHCSPSSPTADGGSASGVAAGLDSGVPDSGIDSGIADSGVDSGLADSGVDSGSPDSGPDSGVDSGSPDSGLDSGVDSGLPDSGLDSGVDSGVPDSGGTCAGCLNGAACEPGDAGAACGESGAQCQVCSLDETCVNRGCSACGGCIDAAGVCQTGNSSAACGLNAGACSVCGSGQVCVSGGCCTPDCSGRACGSDGCGGSCGGCFLYDVCTSAGQCIEPLNLVAGGGFSCAALSGAPPQCWGADYAGQLGDSRQVDSPVPVQVGLASADFLAAGDAPACAGPATAGEGWGATGGGELGDGQMGAPSGQPVQVSGLGAMAVVFAGYYHTCALSYLSPGLDACWGQNGFGQLGNNSTADSDVPILIHASLGGGIVANLAGGGDHTCAVFSPAGSTTFTGPVWCWGDGLHGELGNGQSTSSSSVPVQVQGISSAKRVAAGMFHACALVGAQVWCWGDNSYGQLGNGTHVASAVPVQVTGLPALTSGSFDLAAGGNHTCVTVNQQVWCWGDNASGELGNGSTTASPVPVQVQGLAGGAYQVAAGETHTCALLYNAIMCWGDNAHGELGNGATIGSPTPVSVLLR